MKDFETAPGRIPVVTSHTSQGFRSGSVGVAMNSWAHATRMDAVCQNTNTMVHVFGWLSKLGSLFGSLI